MLDNEWLLLAHAPRVNGLVWSSKFSLTFLIGHDIAHDHYHHDVGKLRIIATNSATIHANQLMGFRRAQKDGVRDDAASRSWAEECK